MQFDIRTESWTNLCSVFISLVSFVQPIECNKSSSDTQILESVNLSIYAHFEELEAT